MTTYHLVTNSVQPQQVRETEDAYVIEDVPFITNMQLSGGYVPRANIEETAPRWDGVPATLQHARDGSGRPIAANRKPEIHLGISEDPQFDGEHTRANIRVAKDRLETVDGASAVKEKLENEEPIQVSSQYASKQLPAGEYDGEMRDNVEKIVRPDSIALLPNQQGKCSLEDGCGIKPQLVANADVSIPMTQSTNAKHGEEMDSAAEFEPGDLVRWSTSESPGTGRVNDVVTEPGETLSAEGADVTREATEDEAAYKLDNWNGSEFETGTVVKSASEMIGAWDDAPDEAMQANAATILDRVADLLGLRSNSTETRGAESPVDSPETMSNTEDTNRENLINEIVANSQLTESALSERCDDGLEAIHSDVVGNADSDPETDEEETTMEDNDKIGLDDLTDEAQDALVDQAAERIEANREADKKDELAQTIVANSAEYDDPDAVTEDYPTVPALEAKRDTVTQSGGIPPAGGDMDVIGNTDDDIEVSSGVLTE